MQNEITTISLADLNAVTGGQSKLPDPPGELPSDRPTTWHIGDVFGRLGGARAESRWRDNG